MPSEKLSLQIHWPITTAWRYGSLAVRLDQHGAPDGPTHWLISAQVTAFVRATTKYWVRSEDLSAAVWKSTNELGSDGDNIASIAWAPEI